MKPKLVQAPQNHHDVKMESHQRISKDDLEYLLRLREDIQTIPQIDQQINDLAAQKAAIIGAYNSWGEMLATRYGIDPQRDLVNDDGSIRRGGALPPVAARSE
jgi:beta-phosphoglucomutase-like phosphatase (HAD superfamily)